MNKTIFRVILVLVFAVLSAVRPARGQVRSEVTLPPNGNNERAEVSQWIGLVKVSIEYHSPNVHGGGGADRTGHLWGELIPYGFFDDGFGPSHATPWRGGANETTTISFSHDVKIDGKTVKAGTYGLFLALDKTEPWTWILSTNATGWGGYQYDSKEDVLRVAAMPQEAPYTEFLTYGFDERLPSSAVAYLQWEKKRVSFKVEVPNINELYVEQIRKDLNSWPGFNYQNWQTAAGWCAANKINLDEALVWAEKAIHEPFRGVARGGKEEYSTLRTKAVVLEVMNRTAESDAVMEKALTLPGADVLPLYFYSSRLVRLGRKEKGLEVAKVNQQRHPEEKYWTYLGLAEAYTALDEKPEAIRNWETVLANVPVSERLDVPRFKETLKKLKGTT
jgi:Protein of unknown function (DUF2911)